MDNGAGAITGTHLAEMNPVEEEILESKFDNRVVAGLHEPKDSDGDEVFEEVIEGNLDDVTLASNGFSADISAHDVFFEGSNLPAVDQICGVSHVGEMVEAATAAADDVGSPAKEGLENGQNSLVADGVHELLVANVNYKWGTASEGVPTNGEKVINEDGGIATVNDSGSIKEVVTEKLRVVDNFSDENNDKELMVVSEREASKDNQCVEEKSVQVSVLNHMLETRDAEGMEPAHGIACQKSQIDGLLLRDGKVHDLKDVGTVVGKNHLDEAYREPGLTSAGISPEEQTNEFEKKEALAGGSEEDIVEFLDASAGSKVEHEESNDASHGDDSHGIKEVVWDDETSKEPDDQITLLSDERGGSLELNDNSSVKGTSFEKVPDKEKSDTVTTIPGIDKSDTNQIGHAEAGVSATCNPNIVEEYAREDRVDKEERKYQTSRETKIKPVAAGASPPGPSSNPALPSTRPAGLGHGVPLLEPTPRLVQQPRANGTTSHVQAQLVEGSANGEPEEGDETREKLQMIRVKFLRLAHRLGQTPHNVVVAQVLYRLGLAEQLRGRNGARTGNFSFDRASAMAEQLEATGQEPLDFSCTIMVLGKTGVGKSATINSIFDEVKFSTDAFQSGTKKVQDVVGTVQGIKVRVIDTPGLLPSWSDQRQNGKILHSVKRFIKKSPPDIILYLDRLDMQSRDLGDMLLLRTITDTFGPSIWFNAIVVLTHAATAPPDGPNGVASSYEMLVTQRSHVVQNAIRQAAGDMRLMNPVALVENHSACRTNRAGQRVLPNGQVWKPHLLLLSFASKILAEANTLLKLQDTPPGKPFPTRSRTPPLPFLLSSLLQSRPQLKLPEEQFGDDDEDAFDDDLDDSSDSDDESEYDELPPFKRLTNAQLAKLTKDQRKSYYDELEYREKLFMKKQLKEEKKRRKMMKKMAAAARDMPNDYAENVEDESGAAASVPVPMPDLALPASFDADNPTHRYRCLDNSNQWLVRPVLDSHGWDHDVGYEGINAERLFVVKNKIPLSVSGQVSKDKKEANVQMEVSSSMKHGEGKGTTVGFDMQSAGKEMAYTLRSETRFSNYRHNKATAGISATLLGDTMSAGLKVEDKLIVNKRFRMVMSGGAMTSRGDVAYGGSLEASLRDKDYPLGRFLSTLGLSVMDWHGDLAIGCNVQSQIPVGRFTNLIARGNLNNRGSGQVSIRLNSSEQIQIALIGLIPLIQKMIGQPQQHPYGH